jgi:hypothetical protein
MAKLPPQFVKTPADAPARRARKTSIVSAEAPPPDVRDVVLRLGDDELRALEDARAALRRAGEDVSLDQMIHRVLADWTRRNQATAAPAPVESLVDRLRTLAAAPLRTWRELGTVALRRMSGLLAR